MGNAGSAGEQGVVVVTGGGGGIGAAIAQELGRRGRFVVTVDPMVSVDGSEQLPAPEETTAGRIVAAGGAARASALSVTDRDGVRSLFADLVAEFGRVDGVVNVAGITRPTGFTRGHDADWRSVLEVHLDGYRNILDAALPLMAEAGYGRILGVTSGSGWRAADTGAYGCAKRAVASLTWELGRGAPPGVLVNAISPIAMTRMVTAALSRSKPAAAAAEPKAGGGASTTGGLSLGSMPAPEEMGPLGAHLVGDDVTWCQGQVLFAGGSEVAVVDRPRLLEVVQSTDVTSLGRVLDVATASALVPAEAAQATTGASNPRFGSVYEEAPPDAEAAAVRTCAIVTDHPEVARDVRGALEQRGVSCEPIVAEPPKTFDDAARLLTAAVERTGGLDAVVVALRGQRPGSPAVEGWEGVLRDHAGIVDRIHADAAWARAVAELSKVADRPIRLATVVDATTAGGRGRAQAVAQLARSAQGSTDGRVAAFAIGVESAASVDERAAGELVAHLLAGSDTVALSGAELVVGSGWIGIRSHPRPLGCLNFAGPALPSWFDAALASMVAGTTAPSPYLQERR